MQLLKLFELLVLSNFYMYSHIHIINIKIVHCGWLIFPFFESDLSSRFSKKNKHYCVGEGL